MTSSFTVLVFLATATLLLAGQARGVNLCSKANFPAVCHAAVKNLKDPHSATRSAINLLIFKTAKAKVLARRFRSSDCNEIYDDAVYNLFTCLENLKGHDKASLNINLSAALSDYEQCDDTFADFSRHSPLVRTNKLLKRMASNGLYLASLTR